MANFSPGAMFKIGREKLQKSSEKFMFQPGLKFECDYRRFAARLNGLKLSSCIIKSSNEA